MAVTDFLIDFKYPRFYFYAGENHVELYQVIKGNAKRIQSFEKILISDLKAHHIAECQAAMTGTEIGIIMNSAHFIFHFFDFEKFPIRTSLRRDLVEWRVKKVFPENIDLYVHDFFMLSRKRVLSLLLNRQLKEKMEQTFMEHGLEVIYFGNSTVEMVNNLRRRRLNSHLLIELDGTLAVLTMRDGRTPFYIRKFSGETTRDMVTDVVKTLNYVKSNYPVSLSQYVMVDQNSPFDLEEIHAALAENNLTRVPIDPAEVMFLPGAK